MVFFRTHQNNIADIRAAVRVFSEVYFHADGNMFNKDNNGKWTKSENHQKYTNEGNRAAKYRVLINSSNMPHSKAHLDKMLTDSYNQELAITHSTKNQSAGRVDSFVTTDFDYVEPDAEIDFTEVERPKPELSKFNKAKKAKA